jgi:hypothetical protein
MNSLKLFGLFSVTVMVLFYALEKRSIWFIPAFSLSCLLASGYAFLEGAWPFGIVEIIWSMVAIRRFQQARDSAEAVIRSNNDA